jgi:hypothetical protein
MSNDLTALRAHMFAQLAELRATDKSDPEAIKLACQKTAAVSDLSKAITDTAKVEVDYLRATGGGESAFIDPSVGADNLPTGITAIVRHRLAG